MANHRQPDCPPQIAIPLSWGLKTLLKRNPIFIYGDLNFSDFQQVFANLFSWRKLKKVQDKGLGALCREKPLEKSGLEPAFGAAGSSPDFSRGLSRHGAPRPLSWTFFQETKGFDDHFLKISKSYSSGNLNYSNFPVRSRLVSDAGAHHTNTQRPTKTRWI